MFITVAGFQLVGVGLYEHCPLVFCVKALYGEVLQQAVKSLTQAPPSVRSTTLQHAKPEMAALAALPSPHKVPRHFYKILQMFYRCSFIITSSKIVYV